MSTAEALYNERKARLDAAIALKKTDRTPVMSWSDAYCANHVGAPMSRFSQEPLFATEVIAESFARLPGYDACERGTAIPDWLGAAFLSKVKVAGRDLPEGSPWNIDERERLTEEDYDRIAADGWNAFFLRYCKEHLDIDVPAFSAIRARAQEDCYRRMDAIGMPVYTVVIVPSSPLEPLSAGRSMSKFTRDLFRIPDRVQAAMDAMIRDFLDVLRQALRGGARKPLSVFLGCARSSPEFLSPRLFERFTWPYLRQTIEAVLAEGVVANLHLHTSWDRELERFKEFPKGTCLLATDHATDIRKAKAVLGDRMCIKGDVPSPLLAVGTPDEVYAYCRRLIDDMGDGFILAPACTMPANAKPENVEAMLAAAHAM
jgi:hypothetical protein